MILKQLAIMIVQLHVREKPIVTSIIVADQCVWMFIKMVNIIVIHILNLVFIQVLEMHHVLLQQINILHVVV